MEDCIFCKIVAGQIPAKKVGENEGAIAFPDINPVAPVHILVIPKKHLRSLDEADDGAALSSVFALAREVARANGLQQSGWRAVINTGRDANQVVFHVHLHVIGGRPMGWPPG
ncbi:MAG: histidine triad nucleotide-binding protein [Deltaproteobacteria bacterium]